MRLIILAVPPLIPIIHGDLRMSETEVGILAGLPVALFAAAAIRVAGRVPRNEKAPAAWNGA
jgi:cyanate permease